MSIPVIPQTITVHLGPPDSNAPNVRVPFIDYIKNVASSEIYPTWPENAIRANVYAQITYALNRIYTEFYRSRGYDFDITNSTQYDQAYREGRDYFENISLIVDDIFNDYVVKQGTIQPYFTQYCDGINTTCPGLSQWGTVDLANQGMTPYEILQHYYGDDINIVMDAPVAEIGPSYPGIPLRLGSAGEEVRTIQRELNRISQNYPSIPRIPVNYGVFDAETEAAVKQFQKIFNLTPDGIVGKGTWYKLKSIYTGVLRLSELYSEGLTLSDVERRYPGSLQQGDSGEEVRVLQYYLGVVSFFDDAIPISPENGYFGPSTTQTVVAFQQKYGLPDTGVVDQATWNKLIDVYDSTIASLPPQYGEYQGDIYPGYFLVGLTVLTDKHIKVFHQFTPLPTRGLTDGINAIRHILCLGKTVLVTGQHITLDFLCIFIAACGFEEHFKYRTFFGCFNLGFPVIRMLDDCDIAFDDLFIHIVCGTVQLYRV